MMGNNNLGIDIESIKGLNNMLDSLMEQLPPEMKKEVQKSMDTISSKNTESEINETLKREQERIKNAYRDTTD